MKTSAILAPVVLLVIQINAAPSIAPAVVARQFKAGITFIGVDPSDTFFMSFPANDEPVTISKSSGLYASSRASEQVENVAQCC